MVFMKCHRQYIEGGKVDNAGKKGRENKNRQTNKQKPRRKGLYRSNKQGQGVIGKRVYILLEEKYECRKMSGVYSR